MPRQPRRRRACRDPSIDSSENFRTPSEALLAEAHSRRHSSAARHHQLHRHERKRRDVGRHHHQRNGVENRRASGRFPDHRRRPVARPGCRRRRIHWPRRRESARCRRAHHRRKYASRHVAEGSRARCLKRVARNFDNDEKRLAAIDIHFYVLRKDGEYCGASLWNKARTVRGPLRGLREGPARHESSVYLLERKG